MGRAFSEEERLIIKERIKKESFKLFKKNGIKKTSIEEITKNVGISQGGFYTFYKNKREVFYDIIEDDVDIQIKNVLKHIEESVNDPAKMIYECIEHHCRHIQSNRIMWIDEPDIMDILNLRKEEDTHREKEKFKSVLLKLNNYWMKKKCIKSMDVEKLLSVFLMARTMSINKECCDDDDFKEIFDMFVFTSIKKYLIVNI